MSSGSACWILWLTPMDWLALSIGRSGSQPLEYSSVVEYISEGLLSLTACIKLQCKLSHLADLLIKAHTLSYVSILFQIILTKE